jgi:F-type H+-transporting ATPase subunit a
LATAEHAAHSPLAQFEIKPLIQIHVGGLDLSFTNSALMMVIALALAITLLIVGTRKRAVVPGRLQSIAELSYEFVANIVRESVGAEGRAYFPLVFSLFIFVLFGNMLGMIPYGFTFTSHIIVTFTMALMVFLLVTILGFAKHGIHFFTFFCPPGVSWILMPLMIPIEIISYLSRPISLGVRLFANMTAGHIMLKVFAGFVPTLGVLGILPLGFVFALTGLELLIAFLQAYVFAVLTSLYINDALHLH